MEPETAAPTKPSRQGFLSELLEVLAGRGFFLVLGVLLIPLGFVLSYVGAFHHPTPHRVPIVVVASAEITPQLLAGINSIPGTPLAATSADSEATGRQMLREGSTSGALVINVAGTNDMLYVAGGGGAATSAAVETVVAGLEAAQQRTVTVTDDVPAQSGDARGLSGFYVVVGLLIGGYLVASLLGVSMGSRPVTTRRAVIRLIAMMPYAVVAGFGAALIVSPWLGALTGHFVAIWWLGALIVYCAAAVTMAFQVLFGVIGIGITIVLFVVLGNPSAGGVNPAPLLPSFWSGISEALPNGAGVQALRKIVYFDSHGIGRNLVVLFLYATVGVAVAIAGTAVLNRRNTPVDEPTAFAT